MADICAADRIRIIHAKRVQLCYGRGRTPPADAAYLTFVSG